MTCVRRLRATVQQLGAPRLTVLHPPQAPTAPLAPAQAPPVSFGHNLLLSPPTCWDHPAHSSRQAWCPGPGVEGRLSRCCSFSYWPALGCGQLAERNQHLGLKLTLPPRELGWPPSLRQQSGQREIASQTQRPGQSPRKLREVHGQRPLRHQGLCAQHWRGLHEPGLHCIPEWGTLDPRHV